MTAGEIVVYAIRGLIVLAFAVLAWREIAGMFVVGKFSKQKLRFVVVGVVLLLAAGAVYGTPVLGVVCAAALLCVMAPPGISRAWAVARETMLEAWAGRVWLLPVLWLVVAGLLLMAVNSFDLSERIPLYIKMLLGSQEVLLLIMVWVMACVSLPRERERKILITTASKPISRLEIILGKVMGFGAVAGLLLLVMGAASLVVLLAANQRVRTRARAIYEQQKGDVASAKPEGRYQQLAEVGSLFANNYVTVQEGGLNIGYWAAEDVRGPARRGLIGGTQERAVYHFSPRLEEPEFAMSMQAGARPYFQFFFPPQQPLPDLPMPAKVQIRVSVYAEGPVTPQEKVLTLNSAGYAVWDPDRPDELYSTFDPRTTLITRDRGRVTVEVSCLTPGVILPVFEGADPDANGNMPADALTNIEFRNRLAEYSGSKDVANANFPQARPTVRGFERRERQEIAGPKQAQPLTEWASYRFPAASLRDVPLDDQGNFKLTVVLDTDKGDSADKSTDADILIEPMDGSEPFQIKQQVDEKRAMTILVPKKHLGNADPAKRADLLVLVRCATPDHSISLIEDSVRIELGQTPFVMNLFKSELVMFFEALLLITIAVTCSVRLGWAVSMLLSGSAFLFGNLVGFIASLPDYGGLGALNYHANGQNSGLYNFFDTTTGIVWKSLGFVSILVPNFTLYQPQQYISSLQNIPWSVVWSDASATLVYVVPLLALAHLMFRKQELG